MRIAWVTPFSSRSAIGRVSASATAALAQRGHEIIIVRSERERSDHMPSHPTALPIHSWIDVDIRDLNIRFDVIVLNVGDNYNFHAGIFPFIEGPICFGIFHDFYLYNLFNQWVALNQLSDEAHDQEVLATYGEGALAIAHKAWRGEARLEDLAISLPMTEWIASRCGAALVHSQFYLNRIEASCPGPVGVAPLPFEARGVPPLLFKGHEEVVLATIGVLNPNKCVADVIDAICASPTLRQRCRYRLIGVVSDAERARLSRIAANGGFTKLDFLGEIDEAALTKELACSDVLICLRRPVLEGASASAIEGMKSGRPLVVADAGFYRDLPDDLVFKVSESFDLPELTAALERLASNESLRVETAARARAWAFEKFTNARYVAAVEALAEDFIRAKPLLSLGQRVGRELAILGVSSDDPAVGNFTYRMRELFGVA